MAKERGSTLTYEGSGPPVDLPGIPTPRGGYVPGKPVFVDELNLSDEEARALAGRVSALRFKPGKTEKEKEAPGGEKK